MPRRLPALVLVVLLTMLSGVSAGATTSVRTEAGSTATDAWTIDPTRPAPVYAYFYQWYAPSSWRRAKQDYPLAGRYSSDDVSVLREQVRSARAAGINGFLTSWKSTPTLNRRLDLLVGVAREQHLELGVVYEALDFARTPLPVATVKADLVALVTRWGGSLRSSYFGRPVIIWTGTDQYSLADVQAVHAALGPRAYLLAAAKQVADYRRLAGAVDGEAYYWSSADPGAPSTLAKLTAMGQAVHAHEGIWIAPAASGFDGRTLGHSRVVDRRNGTALIRSLDNAFASTPDAVGIISWNEWSENTYIEPGEHFGTRELEVLRQYLTKQGARVEGDLATSSGAPRPAVSWAGLRAAVLLTGLSLLGVVGLTWRRRRSLAL